MIYVITHKVFDDAIVPSEGYKVLHVGTNEHAKSYYLRDDTGDNISEKNSSYCELTGLYWIWKNGKEKENDIVGLVHYRRFFTTKNLSIKYAYRNKMPLPLDIDNLSELLIEPKMVILPEKSYCNYTLEVAYSINHNIENLRTLKYVISQLYPEYLGAFNKVFKGKIFYGYNMMVCRKKDLVLYCEWLFSILEKLESLISVDEITDNYQRRIFGFISERLLQV